MATPSINVRITGSGQRPSTGSGNDGISGSIVIQHKTKAIQPMSIPVEPEEVTVNIKKPNIAKLTAEALNTTASLVEQIGNEDSADAADIMRKSAKVAEAIPTAVAGIKREVKPAATAIGNLWDALEEKGIVGVRKKVNIADMHKKNK